MNNRTFHRVLGSALLTLVALSGQAIAQSSAPAPDFLRDFVYPRNGASTADEVFVLYADNCGRPHPDSTRAATVTRSAGRVEVDLYLEEPETTICAAVFLPDRLHAVAVGRLPRGTHDVVRRLHARPFGGSQYRLLLQSQDAITIGDAPNPAASGTWYDPLAPGAGLVMNLLPSASGEERGQALIILATRRTNGASEWMSGVSRFVDAVLTVPLRLPGTPGAAPADATAVFTYTGCGQATLRVSDPSLQFPLGNAALVQLTGNEGVLGCRPPATRPTSLE